MATRGDVCVLLALHVRQVSSLPLTAFRDALCRVARPPKKTRETEIPSAVHCPRFDDRRTDSRRLRRWRKLFRPSVLGIGSEVCIMIQSVGDSGDQTGILNFRVAEIFRYEPRDARKTLRFFRGNFSCRADYLCAS